MIYNIIKEWYGDEKAERSGVPLINHIDEGIKILQEIGATWATKEAFMLHPMFQDDKDLKNNKYQLYHLDDELIVLVLEYRYSANRCLSNQVDFKQPYIPFLSTDYYYFKRKPKLSIFNEVNQMLIADKVQNRKDFELYHKGLHKRSNELDFYFKGWLEVLGINEERYQQLKRLIT